MTSIYQQQIIDHYKYPRNFVKLDNPTIEYGDKNPVCGDEIHFDIILNKDSNVIKVGFQGQGCAISMASASLLTEVLEEMDLEKLKLSQMTILERCWVLNYLLLD